MQRSSSVPQPVPSTLHVSTSSGCLDTVHAISDVNTPSGYRGRRRIGGSYPARSSRRPTNLFSPPLLSMQCMLCPARCHVSTARVLCPVPRTQYRTCCTALRHVSTARPRTAQSYATSLPGMAEQAPRRIGHVTWTTSATWVALW
eukprot:3264338-Rhodomonas_salina.1